MEHDIKRLADKYETSEFLIKDPSQFMHRFTDPVEQELVAFIAANLAFGRRDQILSHVEQILSFVQSENMTPSQWILTDSYKKYFTQQNSKKSFYRMFNFGHMALFFESLKAILKESGSLGEHFKKLWQEACNSGSDEYLHQVIARCFPEECPLVSHGKDGAAKKVNMFLRWMVRDNSPVDLGLWTWYDKSRLLMPLDIHVMQEAVSLGFLKTTAAGKIPAANLKTAVELSRAMEKFFPGDPVKGDYALFGLGADTEKAGQ